MEGNEVKALSANEVAYGNQLIALREEIENDFANAMADECMTDAYSALASLVENGFIDKSDERLKQENMMPILYGMLDEDENAVAEELVFNSAARNKFVDLIKRGREANGLKDTWTTEKTGVKGASSGSTGTKKSKEPKAPKTYNDIIPGQLYKNEMGLLVSFDEQGGTVRYPAWKQETADLIVNTEFDSLETIKADKEYRIVGGAAKLPEDSVMRAMKIKGKNGELCFTYDEWGLRKYTLVPNNHTDKPLSELELKDRYDCYASVDENLERKKLELVKSDTFYVKRHKYIGTRVEYGQEGQEPFDEATFKFTLDEVGYRHLALRYATGEFKVRREVDGQMRWCGVRLIAPADEEGFVDDWNTGLRTIIVINTEQYKRPCAVANVKWIIANGYVCANVQLAIDYQTLYDNHYDLEKLIPKFEDAVRNSIKHTVEPTNGTINVGYGKGKREFLAKSAEQTAQDAKDFDQFFIDRENDLLAQEAEKELKKKEREARAAEKELRKAEREAKKAEKAAAKAAQAAAQAEENMVIAESGEMEDVYDEYGTPYMLYDAIGELGVPVVTDVFTMEKPKSTPNCYGDIPTGNMLVFSNGRHFLEYSGDAEEGRYDYRLISDIHAESWEQYTA